MKKKWVFMLGALIIFFGWFIYSLFYSTGEEWWTLYYLEQIESDVFVAHISWVKVLASGLIIFIPLFMIALFSDKLHSINND
jgi:hypothetical protein